MAAECYALIEDGVVTNIILLDAESPWRPQVGSEAVKTHGTTGEEFAKIGASFDSEAFAFAGP